ncbi:MAG: hypothetical protein HYV07_27025 [Deltaproteobacteria bacterium]|nr:hypothetical protein [Deltaproteobacteria bacterium]
MSTLSSAKRSGSRVSGHLAAGRRPRALALATVSVVSCAPQGLLHLPLPELRLARTIVVLIRDERGETFAAADARDLDQGRDALRVPEVPGSIRDGDVIVLSYPHTLAAMRIEPGVLIETEGSPRPVPEPMAGFRYDFEGEQWLPLRKLSETLKGLRFPVQRGGGREVAEVVVGTDFSCARRGDGDVACWGANAEEQLGMREPAFAGAPTALDAVHGLHALAAGNTWACGIDETDRVLCWGNTDAGQLGRGPTESRRPAPVLAPGSVVAISTGQNHACAVSAAGEVSCWGANSGGAVGPTELEDDILEPAVVPLPVPALGVATGVEHTCALLADGSVWCWGGGARGQLGSTGGSRDPVHVGGVSHAVELAAGAGHTCARLEGGELLCWGDNTQGQLGVDEEIPKSASPLESQLEPGGRLILGGSATCLHDPAAARLSCAGRSVSGLDLGSRDPILEGGLGRGLVGLSLGTGTHACAASLDGVSCWGWGALGQLGSLRVPTYTEPVPLPTHAEVAVLAAGRHGTCVIDSAHRTSCFGVAFLDPGFRPEQAQERSVLMLPSAAEVELSLTYACARTSSTPAEVWCWGSNVEGQLGLESPDNHHHAPAPVVGALGAIDVAVTSAVGCAALTSGELLCWGLNVEGQLGPNVPRDVITSPTPIPLEHVRAVALGDGHACAIAGESGELYCWGQNQRGELGTGRIGTDPFPRKVALPGSAMELAAGSRHTCVRLDDRRVACFGQNVSGQVGGGTTSRGVFTPAIVPGIEDAAAIAVGNHHTCVLHENGAVSCFGSNDYGQLGNARLGQDSPSPTPVLGIEDAIGIAAGSRHTCLLRRGGRVACFGLDSDGQLGQGSLPFLDTPTRVPGLP